MALTKPKRLWRGLDRDRLKKLKNALDMIWNRDSAMIQRAETAQLPGFYFVEEPDNDVQQAIETLWDRIDACLNATV